jgi:osmotically-inducible protein OsmY
VVDSSVRNDEMSEELQAYVLRAMHRHGTGVTVSFDAGAVILDGEVSSAVHARAIEDLIGAHDAVTTVVNRLRVEAPAPVRPSAV